MTTLGEALRAKYKSPRAAMEALGLDAALLGASKQETKRMPATAVRPTRIAAMTLGFTARAVRPLLAMDAKIELMPIFQNLTTKNFKDRKPAIINELKALLKGKTIAQDADLTHVEHLLGRMENAAMKEPKSADESVSEPQHKAMEAAAHGNSNLGIPENVGREFSQADKGKGFDSEAFSAHMRGKGFGEDAIKEACDYMGMHAKDEMPENALDESDEEKRKREEDEAKTKKEKEAEDARARDAAMHGKDNKDMGADSKKFLTQDQADQAIATAIKANNERHTGIAKAREDVRPYVGDLTMAFDTADGVYRQACKMRGIADVDDLPGKACLLILKQQPTDGERRGASAFAFDSALSTDATKSADLRKQFGLDRVTAMK
jgi:hypothetical protein